MVVSQLGMVAQPLRLTARTSGAVGNGLLNFAVKICGDRGSVAILCSIFFLFLTSLSTKVYCCVITTLL